MKIEDIKVLKEKQQQAVREIILKYTVEDALKPQYDGMTAWELAGIILEKLDSLQLELLVSKTLDSMLSCVECGRADCNGMCKEEWEAEMDAKSFKESYVDKSVDKAWM